jgi:hypothetical protein
LTLVALVRYSPTQELPILDNNVASSLWQSVLTLIYSFVSLLRMIPIEHHHNNPARSSQEWSRLAYWSDPPRHYASVPRLLLKPVDRRVVLYICSGSRQAGFPGVLLAHFRSLEYEAANKDHGRSSYVVVHCKGMYILCRS